ncbi:MAG: hypothetical protein ABIR56_19425 [Polaromonas sp.]
MKAKTLWGLEPTRTHPEAGSGNPRHSSALAFLRIKKPLAPKSLPVNLLTPIYPQFLWATLCITLFKSLQSRTTTGFAEHATKSVRYPAEKAKKVSFCL